MLNRPMFQVPLFAQANRVSTRLSSQRTIAKQQQSRFVHCVLLLVTLAVVLLMSNTAEAACKGHGCACIPSQIQFASPVLTPNEEGKYPISLEADAVESQGETIVTLTGNAEVSQGRNTIVADQLKYYRDTERVVANGNIEIISERGDYLSGESIDIHVPTQIGQLLNSEFKLARSMSSADGIDTVSIESRGFAGQVDLEGEGLTRLSNVKYTTCPEGNKDVMISAGELVLDQISGVGKARNATVRFLGVPVFYAPYLTFPINDERKTGFLSPSFGNDEESGNVFEFPWYWNIAKNQDATITPRFYTDRGVQIAAEYRRDSATSSTRIFGEVLPDDDLFGETRDLLSIQHEQRFTSRLTGSINYNDVSDIDYFDDLRNDARYFSATFVPRDVQLNYSDRYVRVRARANEFQVIDDAITNVPYERLPSITLSTNLPNGPYGLKYGLNASYTDFVSDTRVEGTRLALSPFVELPFENIWGYVKPRVSFHHRTYDLDNQAEDLSDDPSFSVPIFSIDAGIYLEKNINWLGAGALQTLEPRVFYVYAPDEDQTDVPVFDTSQVSLNNVGNIFRENRFFGEDRVGDTNQVTFGLTSRIIDNESGDERLNFSIGQLYLIDDLEQSVFNNATPIESGLGDLLVQLRTRSSGAWTTRTFVQFDHDESEITTAQVSIGYAPQSDNRKNISFGYRFSNGVTRDIDQLTTVVNWPISNRWQFFGSNRYSIEDSESLTTDLGVEYNSCCWKLRFSAQDRISNRDIDDKKTSFFIELELTSLGSFRTGV